MCFFSIYYNVYVTNYSQCNTVTVASYVKTRLIWRRHFTFEIITLVRDPLITIHQCLSKTHLQRSYMLYHTCFQLSATWHGRVTYFIIALKYTVIQRSTPYPIMNSNIHSFLFQFRLTVDKNLLFVRFSLQFDVKVFYM